MRTLTLGQRIPTAAEHQQCALRISTLGSQNLWSASTIIGHSDNVMICVCGWLTADRGAGFDECLLVRGLCTMPTHGANDDIHVLKRGLQGLRLRLDRVYRQQQLA